MENWSSSDYYVIAKTVNGHRYAMAAKDEKIAANMADEAVRRETNNKTPVHKAYYTTRKPDDADQITFIEQGKQDQFLPRR